MLAREHNVRGQRIPRTVASSSGPSASCCSSPQDAERLDILSSARILAPLTYNGPSDAQIAEGAVINGPVTFDRIPARHRNTPLQWPRFSRTSSYRRMRSRACHFASRTI